MTAIGVANPSVDILIVEDDPMLKQVMALQLELDGWQVRSASSAQEALRLIRERVPSVLILDVVLPDRSAFELIAELRLNSATCSLRLIVHTSLSLSLTEQGRLKLGHSKFVTKSTVFSDNLSALIQELIQELAEDGTYE